MTSRDIPFERQPALALSYKGAPLSQIYRPDLICHGKIIVEIKAVKELTNDHRAQVLNYLKGTGMKLALLVNSGHSPKVQIERIVR